MKTDYIKAYLKQLKSDNLTRENEHGDSWFIAGYSKALLDIETFLNNNPEPLSGEGNACN